MYMIEATVEQKERLKNLSEHRTEIIEGLAEIQMENINRSGLDPRTHALCRFATLVAIDAPIASYAWQLAVAEDSDVTLDDLTGVLVAQAPTVGMAKIVAAANKLSVLYGIAVEFEEAA
jgi:4-carboxymuconolactone decarboxylase